MFSNNYVPIQIVYYCSCNDKEQQLRERGRTKRYNTNTSNGNANGIANHKVINIFNVVRLRTLSCKIYNYNSVYSVANNKYAFKNDKT